MLNVDALLLEIRRPKGGSKNYLSFEKSPGTGVAVDGINKNDYLEEPT